MKDMNAGVEAFRAKLQALGAKNIGLYIGTYFMEEHSISTDKFTALWIPTYGFDDGYYNAAPDTNTEYDLHQYTSRAIKWILTLLGSQTKFLRRKTKKRFIGNFSKYKR